MLRSMAGRVKGGTARPEGRPGGWAFRLCLLAALTLSLGACGTDIKWLLAKEAQGAWANEDLIREAESRHAEDPVAGALSQVRAAEDDKFLQCEPIDGAVRARLDRVHLPFFEQFWGDLQLLVSLLVPVPFVERCAEAHESYETAVVRLRHELVVGGTDSDERSP